VKTLTDPVSDDTRMMTPNEFEYLIRKTIVYLDFHDDDTAKSLAADWRRVLPRVRTLTAKPLERDRESGTNATQQGDDD